MKTLIHVPMLHSPEDRTRHEEELGTTPGISDPKVKDASDNFWRTVEGRLNTLNPSGARFYLEGYLKDPLTVEPGTTSLPDEDPNLPPEDKIIRDFIYRVGGTVESFEDPKAFEESMAAHKRLGEIVDSTSKIPPDSVKGEDMRKAILTELLAHVPVMEKTQGNREDKLADRINTTLQEGEIGFLFLGATHDLGPKLSPDIHVEPLDESLAEISKELKESFMQEGNQETEDEPTFNDGSPEGRV